MSSSIGGIGDNRFGSGVSWTNYDNGGFLDLYVSNFLDYRKVSSGTDHFFPYDFTGQDNVLYFNCGSSRFMGITKSMGISRDDHFTLRVSRLR